MIVGAAIGKEVAAAAHLETMRDASEAATVIMALKLELAELRTSLDVSLQTERDLSSANEALTSSLAAVTADRDHLRSSLEQTRNVVSAMHKSARKASAERAELRVQAEMLRSENDRCKGYAKMRDECQKLRMENQRLREQLALAEADRRNQPKQTVESRVPSSLYSLSHSPSPGIGLMASTVFSQQPGRSASGVNTLPERQRAHQQQLDCTNEAPKRIPPGICLNREEERLSPSHVSKRASLLGMLSGFSSSGINRDVPDSNRMPESSEGKKPSALHKEPLPKIKPAAGNANQSSKKLTSSSMFFTGQWKSCPARLQQDEAGKGGRRRRAGGRGSIKVLADQLRPNLDAELKGCCDEEGCASDSKECPKMRRTWSGSKLSTTDIEELWDYDSGDDSSTSNVPGDILVPWRHELAEQRRGADTGRQRPNVQRKTVRPAQGPTPRLEINRESQEASAAQSISAKDAAKLICSATDTLAAMPLKQPQLQPRSHMQQPLRPQDEYRRESQQLQEQEGLDEEDDRRDNLTVGTADDVERFFSDMLDEPLVEEDILRDLGEGAYL